MKVIDFLENYISSNVFGQDALCAKLRKELNEGAKINRGWAFFIYLLENKEYGQDTTLSLHNALYHPININRLVNTLFEINDVNKFLLWLDAFHENDIDINNFKNLLNPFISINITDFPVVEANIIDTNINLYCPKEEYFNYRYTDSVHRVITEHHLKPLFKACNINRLQYIAESRDCDDFAFMTRSWFSEQGLGNLTVFYAEINCYDEQDNGDLIFSFSHAVNLVMILKDSGLYELMYVEPQSDKMWKPKDPMPWGWGSKVTKLRYLII